MTPEHTAVIAPWGTADRTALQLLFGGSLVYAAVVLLIGGFSIVSELVTGQRFLTLPISETLEPQATASATLIGGTIDAATAFVSGLSAGASALLTTGSVIALIAHLFVALTFAYLNWRLLRREPFLRSLTWSFVAAGGILSIGSVVAQALTGVGTNLATSELSIEAGYNRIWPLPLSIDLYPLAIGLMLALVGMALEYAQKLSAETRGLV